MYVHMTGAEEQLCKLHSSGTLSLAQNFIRSQKIILRKNKVFFAKPSLFQIFIVACQLKCESLQIVDSILTILAIQFSCGPPVSCAHVMNADIATAGISEVVGGQSGNVNGRRSETGCFEYQKWSQMVIILGAHIEVMAVGNCRDNVYRRVVVAHRCQWKM